MEKWKDIEGYEGFYRVSDAGRVRSVDRPLRNRWGWFTKRGKVLALHSGTRGRMTVVLSKNSKLKTHYVHHLVLEAFGGQRPHGMECCHNDGDASNNHHENLRWDTHQSNMWDAMNHGTMAHGERSGRSKLLEVDVCEIRKRLDVGEAQSAIASDFGISQVTVSNIKRRKSWQHLQLPRTEMGVKL